MVATEEQGDGLAGKPPPRQFLFVDTYVDANVQSPLINKV